MSVFTNHANMNVIQIDTDNIWSPHMIVHTTIYATMIIIINKFVLCVFFHYQIKYQQFVNDVTTF